jgi:hypothetical protein
MNPQQVKNFLPLPFIPSRRGRGKETFVLSHQGRGKWTFYEVLIDELVK